MITPEILIWNIQITVHIINPKYISWIKVSIARSESCRRSRWECSRVVNILTFFSNFHNPFHQRRLEGLDWRIRSNNFCNCIYTIFQVSFMQKLILWVWPAFPVHKASVVDIEDVIVSNGFNISFRFVVLEAREGRGSKQFSSGESRNVIRLIRLQKKCVEDRMLSRIFLSEVQLVVVEGRKSFNYFEPTDSAGTEIHSLCREHVDGW